MKYIFSIIFCAVLQTGFSQMIKTVGISYTNGTPVYVPARAGSWLALDTVTWKYYTYNGSTWLSDGYRIQTISGCSAPAYTPTKFQSLLVINACTEMQGGPELYFWNGSAWLCLNCDAAGTGIDTLTSYTALRAYTGTSLAVYVQNFAYISTPDTFTVMGGFFRRVSSGTEDAGMLIVSGNGVKWQRENADYVAVDWFEGLSAAKRIQRAVSKCVSGSTLNFILPETYTLNDGTFIDSLQNLTITGNYPILKRCNSSASVTTLAGNYGGALSITVTSVPTSWEVGDILVAARGVTNADISTRTVIAGISGNTITLVYQFLNQGGGVFTALAGTSIIEDFTMLYGRPSETEGSFGPRGVNRNVIIERIIFDGNRANNTVALGWTVNSTIGLHGKGSEIRSCVFKNMPNENILGFGLNIHDNYFGDCNGSALHLSGNDATLENTLTNAFTNNIVENCNIISRDTSGHNEGVISFSWNGGNINIIGNYFRSDYGNEAIMGAITGSGANDRENIVFANNQCFNFEKIFGGIDNSSQATTVTGNLFDNCGSNDISVFPNIPWKVCGNNLINGTTFVVGAIHKCDTFNLATEIPGTNGQYLRHNGTKFAAISQATAATDLNYWTLASGNLNRSSGNVGIGSTSDATTPSHPLVVDNMIGVNYGNASISSPNVNLVLGLGRYDGPATNRVAGHLFWLNSSNVALDAAVGEFVLQGRSDAAGAALGNGITLATGTSGAARFKISPTGTYTFNTLSGTGNRLPYLNSAGQLLRGSFDPANLLAGNGTASQVTYYTAAQTLTSGANLTHNGTNTGMGIAPNANRLTISGALGLDYGTANITPAVDNIITMGRINAIPSGYYGGGIYSSNGAISGLNANLAEIVIQGNSSSYDAGVSIWTGNPSALRQYVRKDGTISFPGLAGTGNRLTTLDANGVIGRGSLDPATVLTAVSVNARLTGNGTAGSPLDLASQSATTGQYFRWSGTAWVPATLTPQSLTDAAAANNTIFYSTDRSKLCYKDPGGTVNELY